MCIGYHRAATVVVVLRMAMAPRAMRRAPTCNDYSSISRRWASVLRAFWGCASSVCLHLCVSVCVYVCVGVRAVDSSFLTPAAVLAVMDTQSPPPPHPPPPPLSLSLSLSLW